MFSTTNRIILSLKQLFFSKPIQIGRWNIKHSEKQKNIKFMYSNYDHCGDKVCGTPSRNITKEYK